MQSLKDVFYVKDFDSGHPEDEKLVPAKFLIGLDGRPVVNPNNTLNTINKLDNHYFNADGTEIHDANPIIIWLFRSIIRFSQPPISHIWLIGRMSWGLIPLN